LGDALMLIEAQYNFPVAFIGGTFDETVTLFQLTGAQTFVGTWSPTTAYTVNQTVAASDGNAYYALSTTTGSDPTTDGAVHWHIAALYNLTGYSASLFISGAFTLTSPSSGLTLGGAAGTIAIKATPTQTLTLSPSKPHYYIQLTDGSGNIYFPMGGTITFVLP
jgi:hypothetical protein